MYTSRKFLHTSRVCRQAAVPAQPSTKSAPLSEARAEFTKRAVAIKAQKLSLDFIRKESSTGQTAEFPSEALALFKFCGTPKALQRELALTANPVSLTRPITKDLTEWLLTKASKSASQENLRFLVGKQGSGKSFALLQAVSQAAAAGWIVLYIPSAIPLIDSSWAYQYSAKDQIFYQHAASAELLKTFQQANEAVLKKVKVGDKTLSQIVKDGLAMRDNQAAGLQLVLDALASQTTQPVLLAVDSAQALYRPSRYLSPDPTPYLLDSTALSVPRALLRFASGEQSFKSGAVLLASSASNAYPSSAVDVALGQQQPAAYQARDAKYENLLKSMKAQKVPASMGLTEAAGLAELLKASKRMRSDLNDRTFLEQYVASNGHIRAFVDAFEGSMI